MSLLAEITKTKNGIRSKDLEDSYIGVKEDLDALICGGDVIAISNTEDKDKMIFSRGESFLVEMDLCCVWVLIRGEPFCSFFGIWELFKTYSCYYVVKLFQDTSYRGSMVFSIATVATGNSQHQKKSICLFI